MRTEIAKTGNAKTFAKFTKNCAKIWIGSDMTKHNLKEFLTQLDKFLTNMNRDCTIYGHFNFYNDRFEITLSANKLSPSSNDVVYICRW